MSIQDDLFDAEKKFPKLVKAFIQMENREQEYFDIIDGLKRTICLQANEIGELRRIYVNLDLEDV